MDEAATVLCTLITPYKDFCIHFLPEAVSPAPHFINNCHQEPKDKRKSWDEGLDNDGSAKHLNKQFSSASPEFISLSPQLAGWVIPDTELVHRFLCQGWEGQSWTATFLCQACKLHQEEVTAKAFSSLLHIWETELYLTMCWYITMMTLAYLPPHTLVCPSHFKDEKIEDHSTGKWNIYLPLSPTLSPTVSWIDLKENRREWQMLPADVSERVWCNFHCEHLRLKNKCSWLHNDLRQSGFFLMQMKHKPNLSKQMAY